MKSLKTNEFYILVQSTFKDFYYNFWVLTGFLVFYNLLGIYVVMPFGLGTITYVAKILGFSSINSDNVFTVILNPIILIVIFFVLLLFTFFCLFEITTVIYCIYESHFRKKVQLIPLIWTGFLRALDIFKPKNWSASIYVVFLVPLTQFGLTNDFITNMDIPKFVLGHIFQVTWESIVYYTCFTLIYIFIFLTVFTFFYYSLEKKSFTQSIIKSVNLIRKNKFKTLSMQVIWAITTIFFIGTISFIGSTLILSTAELITSYIQKLNQISIITSLFLGTMSMIYSTFTLVVTTGTTALTISFLSNCYYSLNNMNNKKDYIVHIKSLKFRIPHQKRLIIPIILIMVLGIIFTRSRLAWNTIKYETYKIGLTGPQITAHRGAALLAPENSRSALELAIAEGADWIEIDIIQSKDGVLVVSHDNNLKTRFKQKAIITQTNFEDLEKLDIGSYFSKKFAGEKLITLDEAIEICKGRVKLNIELKPHKSDQQLVLNTINTIYKYDFIEDCVISSNDLPTLFEVENEDPEINTSFNTTLAFGGIELLPVDIISIEQSFISAELIERIHANEKRVWAWTIDDEEEIRLLTEEYIDNIITNDIELAKNVISKVVAIRSENNKDLIQYYLMEILFDYKKFEKTGIG